MDVSTPAESGRIWHWLDRPGPRRFASITLTLAILGVLAIYGTIHYGSISSALSYAGGRRILVDAPVQSFGEMVAGGSASLNYTLRNVTSHRITIQGAQSSCTCAVVDEVPCSIEPGASRTIMLKIVTADDGDRVSGNISLYTDDREIPVITLGYAGRVVKPAVAGLNRGRPD